jgi:hypothetical protein
MARIWCLALAAVAGSCALDLGQAPRPELLFMQTRRLQPVHQCALPVFWTASPEVPHALLPYLEEAFAYWDDLSPATLFFRIEYPSGMSVEEVEATGTVVVVPAGERQRNDVRGETWLRFREQEGCIVRARLLLDAAVSSLPAEAIRNIVRHEVGHVLGADHTADPADLMFFAVSPTGGVKEASPFERRAIGSIYGAARK